MRPVFIGFALMWIISTFVTSFRLLVNAPGIFLVFLVPPVLVLIYGVVAEDPPLKGAPGPQPVPPAAGTLPASPSPDPYYLPPVTRTIPAPPAVVQEPAALPGGALAPDAHYLLPFTSTSPDPLAVVQVPALPSLSLKPAVSGMYDALRYALAAMFGSVKRFVFLFLATLLFALPLSGYLVRVMKGADPAPEAHDWAGLVFDGIRVFLIVVLYLIPGVFFLVILYRSYNDVLGLVILLAFVYLIPAGVLRFARTGSVAAAFGIRSVIGVIGKIGWLSYTGFFILCLILNIGINFVSLIPYLGIVLMVLLIAPLTLFEARYLTLLYDQGET